MEIKDGRITPTDPIETEIFSRLLREQELACERDPSGATKAQQDRQLSGADSYKLFCAAERRVNRALAGSQEVQVIGGIMLGLATDFVERLDIGGLKEDKACFFPGPREADAARVSAVMRLAGQALTDRYE